MKDDCHHKDPRVVLAITSLCNSKSLTLDDLEYLADSERGSYGRRVPR